MKLLILFPRNRRGRYERARGRGKGVGTHIMRGRSPNTIGDSSRGRGFIFGGRRFCQIELLKRGTIGWSDNFTRNRVFLESTRRNGARVARTGAFVVMFWVRYNIEVLFFFVGNSENSWNLLHPQAWDDSGVRIPATPRRSASGCNQPGRHCLRQARSAVR